MFEILGNGRAEVNWNVAVRFGIPSKRDGKFCSLKRVLLKGHPVSSRLMVEVTKTRFGK